MQGLRPAPARDTQKKRRAGFRPAFRLFSSR